MTAQDEHAFLTAVLAAPDDDTPRLVFADWLDERAQGDDTARAALIRAQCRMEHLGPGTKECRELAARAKGVLKEHEPQWTKVLRESGLVRRWTFRRGFLDGVEMSA
ncbi:MAG TPA: TIGR02996 domain-containing protein, partial [Gemmata sp.]